jgi:hypothetical protein
MLNDLATMIPPRVGHRLARMLRLTEVHRMFCPCCPDWDIW